MHESGLIAGLLRQIEEEMRAAGAREVVSVQLWAGALSQFTDAHLREHFLHQAQDTPAEAAHLAIECSEDLTHPDAAHLVLKSIEVR